MSTWRIPRCIAALALWTAVSTTAPAQAGEMLEQTGLGVYESKKKIKKKTAMQARQDAIRLAQQNAVWEAVIGILNDEVARARKDDIERKVLVKSAAFVAKSEVVDERSADKTYEVTISAIIDKDKLSSTLESVGIRADLVSERISVAVLVEEYMEGEVAPARKQGPKAAPKPPEPVPEIAIEFLVLAGLEEEGAINEAPPPATEAFDAVVGEHFEKEDLPRTKANDPYSGAAIGAQLGERDVKLVESAAVRDMLRDLATGGTVVDTLIDATRLGESATLFGQRYGADAVVVGVTKIDDAPTDDGTFMATASLAAKVVDTATGDVLGFTSRSNAGVGADQTAARANAARRVGEIVGEDFAKGLIDYWNTRNERGWELVVRVTGASADLGYAMQRVLKGVEGVKEAETRFSNEADGVVELVVTTKSSPRKLRPEMAAALRADSETSGLAETAAAGAVWTFEAR